MMYGWGNMMGGWGNGGYGGGFGWMGMIMPLIFLIGIILLGIYLFRRSSSQVRTSALNNHSGMDVLRERYARGEIDSEEFQSRKLDLEGK
jgi:putative membrane protein